MGKLMMAYHWPLEAGTIIGEQKANVKDRGAIMHLTHNEHRHGMWQAGCRFLMETSCFLTSYEVKKAEEGIS